MNKPSILIISSSVRQGRKSHRVSLFFQKFINNNDYGEVEILDLKKVDLPLFKQRLSHMENPEKRFQLLSQKISQADGILIVTPEYNGGYPASLKNFIDFLYPEWNKKAVALTSVSSGAFAGSQVIKSIAGVLWKMETLLVPGTFQVPKVADSYDESGNPSNKELSHRLADEYIKKFLWTIRASKVE